MPSTSLHRHALTGCSPTPLAHYLKALGILRLLSEQKDPHARGWWQDEAFHLVTTLDAAAIERFFLEEYRPTPLISPWNKGAGFVFAANNPALDRLRRSTSPRLAEFRAAIQQADAAITNLSAADSAIRAIKGETKAKGLSRADKERIKNDPDYKARLARAERHFKRLKDGLIPDSRRSWRGDHLRWMDSAMVITAEGETRFPSLLGSGGNDGKNDFTKQFMESLCAVADWQTGQPRPEASRLLSAALFSQPAARSQQALPVGQFHPGGAGGANMTVGFDADAQVNPWDYVLLLEGTLAFVPTVSRRATAGTRGSISAPFATRASASGHGSSSPTESDSLRGEQWMPLWNTPSTFTDITGLISEGRVLRSKTTASRPVDFGRAVARLGVARGITAFERYGYLERNGQSNLAIPLGRWQVTPQPRQELLDDLDRFRWLELVQRAARDKFAPRSFVAAQRNLETAIMAVCSRGDEPELWQNLLLSLSEIERCMVQSGAFTAKQRLQPIPPLSAGWLHAIGWSSSPETRLAAALALQTTDAKGTDSIRRHWLPLEKKEGSHKGASRFAVDSTGLRRDPGVVCRGINPENDLLALIRRRAIEGARTDSRHFSLHGHSGFSATDSDLAALLIGDVDLDKTGRLARALLALRRPRQAVTPDNGQAQTRQSPPPIYGLFRLACLPAPLTRGNATISIPFDPAIPARLATGDLAAAGGAALRRLKASGLRPVIRQIAGTDVFARRLALCLAFPISADAASRLAGILTKPQPEKNHA